MPKTLNARAVYNLQGARTRQYLILLFFLSAFIAIFLKLFYLQVLNYNRFAEMADRQHNKFLEVPPKRGIIYDRFMEPFTVNIDKTSIFADPHQIVDQAEIAQILSKILQIDYEAILQKLNTPKAFIWIKRKVSQEEFDAVKRMSLKGIHFIKETERNYPNDSMASHVIGFAGMDNRGLEGLELFYDTTLRGQPGLQHFIRDAKLRLVLDNEADSVMARNGLNLVLTVDNVIQHIVETEIKKMAEKYNASTASAVVMEPYTGKILAMVNYPDYNLNDFSTASRDVMNNAVVSYVFEPGSVFKVVTASAVLSEGICDVDTKIHCENGEYEVAGRILHDFHPYGLMTFEDVIAHSSNIGTVKMAMKLGKDKLNDYIKKFGFGSLTGVDLPGEVAGIVRPSRVWSKSDITTVPIGQGIAVTSIQLARAVSVIANGGYLVKPYIVERIVTEDGSIFKDNEPLKKERVIDEEICWKVKEMMEGVVEKGSGRKAYSEKFITCGKTGTAQMVNPKGGYYDNKYHATFVGFAPKENPLFTIIVTAQDPHPIHFGGNVAAPAFKEIAEKIFEYIETQKTERKEYKSL
ncbi:stage V sporulation protein D [Candidatus Omnitrophus magneticus]|uniref:Stage V sporulation protein D n=1 Tax=Candidatus Omnitrophus magneticus TaxID=1609969 RepID=A0A0F0CMI0_9BACT|nr:stage V sporulation protein D [Candidatus Omnitrophus magneticus]